MFSQFQHQSIDYSANSPKQTNIPAGGMINEIMCELSMAPTIAGASNTAALAMRGDEFGVIGSLQLKGEDALPIIDLPGSFIKWLHWYNYGAPLKVPSTFADGSTANPVISTCFILPMWSTRQRQAVRFEPGQHGGAQRAQLSANGQKLKFTRFGYGLGTLAAAASGGADDGGQFDNIDVRKNRVSLNRIPDAALASGKDLDIKLGKDKRIKITAPESLIARTSATTKAIVLTAGAGVGIIALALWATK
jgi:hypothetical protein